MKDMLACDAVTCAAEIGGALGARYLLTGTARRWGGKLLITLSMIDTHDQVTYRGQAKVQDKEDQYEQALAYIKVIHGGRVYAYASNTDNSTGDSEFIPAMKR